MKKEEYKAGLEWHGKFSNALSVNEFRRLRGVPGGFKFLRPLFAAALFGSRNERSA
jgi:hypothetical protein